MSYSTRRVLGILLFVFSVGCSEEDGEGDSKAAPIWFRECSSDAGISLVNETGTMDRKHYALESIGPGSALFDADNDGDLDVFVVNGSRIKDRGIVPGSSSAFYRNDGNLRFTDLSKKSGLSYSGVGQGALAADFDNDGFTDIFVTAWGKNAMFKNNGDLTFSELAEDTGVQDAAHWGVGACAMDYDLDGDLDLYIANYFNMGDEDPKAWDKTHCEFGGLKVNCGPKGMIAEADVFLRNDGNFKFTDISDTCGIRSIRPAYGLSAISTDFNQDGYPDIYVANDSLANFLFVNNADGTFTEMGMESCCAFSEDGRGQAGMGIAVGDCDNDGWDDIYVTNFAHDYNTLYKNIGEGIFTDHSFVGGFGKEAYFLLGWGTSFFDVDNDRDLDLYAANGHVYPEVNFEGSDTAFAQQNLLYINDGKGVFDVYPSGQCGALDQESVSRGAAFGDLDNDGDIDILVVNLNEPPSLLINEGSQKGHWLMIQAVGTKSNRSGIGSVVWIDDGQGSRRFEVRSGGSFVSSNDSRIHVGLGDSKEASVKVRFPSGVERSFEKVPANHLLIVEEGLETETLVPWK